ncbi:competence protein ComK [Bacillus sp. M6-12]|uniref:competence protein ComK n=1 Tax=Bacillus sp. M6-12 TaxID=2054166 RepID=UPI0015E0CAA3|nr:competence protein ComK [Bacillus sp. M6-12]
MEENERYKVSRSTMALEPAQHPLYQTKISDLKGTYYTRKSIRMLLNEACLNGGAGYSGRLESARWLLKHYKKTPLLICPLQRIYAFPTHSPKSHECMWIFPRHLQSFDDATHTATFKNGTKLIVNCSPHVFHKQKGRAADLAIKLCKPDELRSIEYLSFRRPLKK